MKSWALFLAASTSAGVAEDERKILMHVNENPYMRVESMAVEGLLCAERYSAFDCNHPVRVSIQKSAGFLRVVSSAGRTPLSVEIPLSQLPELDLQSVQISGHYSPDALVLVDIRFGEPNSCYVNDDGRSSLTVSLGEENGARAWITTHEGCEIQDKQIVGDESGN